MFTLDFLSTLDSMFKSLTLKQHELETKSNILAINYGVLILLVKNFALFENSILQ